jgi:hypothetical protein
LAKAVSGQLEEEFSDLEATCRGIVSEFRNLLASASGNREVLGVLGPHAKTIATILKVIFSSIENSRPYRGTDIRGFMHSQMDLLWTVKSILQEEVQLFDDAFQSIIDSGAGQVGAEVVRDLDAIRLAVEESLPDAIRAAWDDLSAESVPSDRRQESRRAAMRSIRDLSGTWETFAEKLNEASRLWAKRGSA